MPKLWRTCAGALVPPYRLHVWGVQFIVGLLAAVVGSGWTQGSEDSGTRTTYETKCRRCNHPLIVQA
jgi:hypothetical protein